MAIHFIRILGICTLIVTYTFLPFLPGQYDAFAVLLSAIAQLLGAVSLLFVLIGLPWVVYEWQKLAAQRTTPQNKGYYFAMAAIVVFFVVASIITLGAFVSGNLSFALAMILLSAFSLLKCIPQLQRLKGPEGNNFNAAPIYLVCIPVIVAIVQFSFLDRALEFSRNRAIKHSAELIKDIEQYHQVNGHYPASIHALWPDYKTSVIGISQYYYKPSGLAYDLFFEQPVSVLQLGTKEIVMYNKLDEQTMNSHAMDMLHLTPEALAIDARRGYYAVYDASTPHWKYFRFD